jgi:HEAT repeat protein
MTISDRIPLVASGTSIEEALLSALGRTDIGERQHVIREAARLVDPEELLVAIGDHEDAARRNAAMEALHKAGPRGVPTLLRALRHADLEVVMFAATLLGKSRDRTAVFHLVELLDHSDINIAQAAIESLAALRAIEAVDRLVEMLRADPWLQFAAVSALGQIGDPRATNALIPLVHDDLVGEAAITALGQIGALDAVAELAVLLGQAREFGAFLPRLRALGIALRHHPDDGPLRHLPSLASLAGGDASNLHLWLIKVLSAPRGDARTGIDEEAKAAAAALVRCLHMRTLYATLVGAVRDPALIDAVMFAVLSIGPEIVPALSAALAHRDPAVRGFAARCAGVIGGHSLASQIQQLVSDADEDVCSSAIEALARLRHEPALPAMVAAVADTRRGVRQRAVQALVCMDAEAVTRAFMIDPPDATQAKLAMLEVIQGNPHPAQRLLIDSALGEPDPDVRRAAIAALAALAPDDLVEAVESSLRHPSADVRREALRAVGTKRSAHARDLILKQLAKDAETRTDAVRALAELRDPTVAQRLIDLLADASPPMRLSSLEALADLREHAAEPMIAKLLVDPDPELRRGAVSALARFATREALRHVAVAAQDPAWEVRAAAVEVFQEDDEDALRCLERLCVDPHPFVASAARRRLEELEKA